MTKKFTKSIFILLFLNILVKPFWIFGIDRTIQNRVGAEEYGLFFSLFGFSLLFNMISDLGITNYNNRYIAQNNDKLGKQLGMIIPVKLFLSLLYSIVTLILAFVIGYSSRQFSILMWLIANQMLISLILFIRSNISALQLFNTDSVISVIDRVLSICICAILLWGTNTVFRIEWLVLTQTISYSATLIVVLIILLKKSGKIIFHMNIGTIKHTLKMSFPFALLTILMMFYTRIDAVMLERMLPDGQTQAGIYAQAFRINDALSMFAVLFANILLPLFSKMLKEQEPIGDTLSHSFALLMVPALSIIVALMLCSGDLMDLLYEQHSTESTKVLSILMTGFGGICLSYIFGTLLTSAGKLKLLNTISLAGLIMNVVLNLFLISRYNAIGAAIASTITQLLVGIIQTLVSIKSMNIKVKHSTPIRYGVLLVLTILFSIILKMIFPWYVAIIAIPVLTIFLGIMMRLIKIENLLGALK